MTEGTTASCHRVRHLPLPLDEFDNFHNLPEKIQDRKLMLLGQWPQGGCEYCKKIEDAGGSSDRTYHLNIPNLTPPELEVDPIATLVSPQIVEVFVNNICNMRCVYCHAACSSQIQQENKKFGDFKSKGVIISNDGLSESLEIQEQYFKKFCAWLEKNSDKFVHLNLLGGETFYQPELDVILDILEKKQNPNLEITIVSNLMIQPPRLVRHIERIKQMCLDRNIGRLALTVSIDCWGDEQEYARHGLNLDIWEKNFSYIVDQHWIRLRTNQTISSLTVRTIPELLRKINFYRSDRPISTEFSLVIGHAYLHPGIFGGTFWKDDFDQILDLMPTETEHQKQSKTYMQGIRSQVLACIPDMAELENFQIYLDEIDHRRGTNWRAVYPYLNERIKKLLINGK